MKSRRCRQYIGNCLWTMELSVVFTWHFIAVLLPFVFCILKFTVGFFCCCVAPFTSILRFYTHTHTPHTHTHTPRTHTHTHTHMHTHTHTHMHVYVPVGVHVYFYFICMCVNACQSVQVSKTFKICPYICSQK